jgi:hypothetical protein
MSTLNDHVARRNFDDALESAEWIDLISRAAALRKARKIGVLLADCGVLYTCDSEFDPWGTRRPLTLGRFRALIEEAESK